MANAASGVGVADDCVSVFKDLVMKKAYRYIVYRIDNGIVVVEKAAARTENYDSFLKCLPDADPRYAIFDYEYTNDEDQPRSKVLFISWSPDNAKTKSKMLYATSLSNFKHHVNGIQVEIQATDASEAWAEIRRLVPSAVSAIPDLVTPSPSPFVQAVQDSYLGIQQACDLVRPAQAGHPPSP
eukprot:jgi/Mesvir1/28197/Mv04751-RA.1